MTAILDQKHYIEELNRNLSGTVADLQAKMDSLEKTNSKLIEEVSLCFCVYWLTGLPTVYDHQPLRSNCIVCVCVCLFFSSRQRQTGLTLYAKNRRR